MNVFCRKINIPNGESNGNITDTNILTSSNNEEIENNLSKTNIEDRVGNTQENQKHKEDEQFIDEVIFDFKY